MAEKQKKPDNTTQDPMNPFHLIKMMIGASVGKLPASLVFILVLAVVLAAVAGLAMQFAEGNRGTEKNELRLESHSDQAIDPQQIQAIWAAQHQRYVMSLVVMSDRFEWIVKDLETPRLRYFVRGGWKLEGDVMRLSQRKDMGYPSDPEDAGLRFIPIPLEDIECHIRIEKGGMVWSVPETEYDRINGLMEDLFDNAPKTEIKWSRQ